MSVRVMCPNLRCRKVLVIPDDARGRIVKCAHCNTTMRVPTGNTPKPAAKPAGASN